MGRVPEQSATIALTVNAKRIEIPRHIDPATKLVDFLRAYAGVKSVKVGCGEGGCGACAVEVTAKDNSTGEVHTKTVNACLVPLANVDACSITTAEGLGNSQTEFGEVQERIAGFHGSQCGFCTPGMVVACHAALHKAKVEGRGVSEEEMEKCIDGNLCRCTGYRPILDTCKSFVSGVDMEDLGVHMCSNSGRDPVVDAARLAVEAEDVQTVSKAYCSDARTWYMPASMQELWQLLSTLRAEDQPLRVVGGNTGPGVYKNWITNEEVIIGTTNVAEFREIEAQEDGLYFGAAATIADVIDVFEVGMSDEDSATPFDKQYWKPFITHLGRIAGHHVRNVATLGGHFALCVSEHHLESDVATVFTGARASLCLADGKSERWLPLEDFLAGQHPNLGRSELITGVLLPYPTTESYFYSDRVAQRYYNSHSFVNMSLSCDDASSLEGTRVVVAYHSTLSDGGTGWQCRRLGDVEAVLEGNPPSFSLLTDAVRAVEMGVSPSGKYAYFVKQVLPGMVLQALAPLVIKYAPPPTSLLPLLDAKPMGEPPTVTSSQSFPDYSADAPPVWQPIVKDKAKLQASGEAQYTGDIPLAADALFGAFVLSTEPLAQIEVDAAESLKVPGVVAFFGAKDVPALNAAAMPADPRLECDPIFAEGEVRYVGQPIGLVVATSQHAAQLGAKAVLVAYGKTLGTPVISLEEAVAHNSFFDPDTYDPVTIVKGSTKRAMRKAHRTITGAKWYLPSQYHFYMEPMTAVAQSDEGGSIKVWSSCQSTDLVQQSVSKALGIHYNKISAVCRRAGGGFGGKASRSQPFACAAAVAAAKLRRQVRIENNRNDDMRMVGSRCETMISYDVAYEPDGVITGVAIKAWFRGGAWMDWALQDMQIMADGIDQTYVFANFTLECQVARTNVPPRTNMRAPGFYQANLIIEHIVEHVASELGVDATLVREMNFLRPGTIAPPRSLSVSTDGSVLSTPRSMSTNSAFDSAFEDSPMAKWKSELKQQLSLERTRSDGILDDGCDAGPNSPAHQDADGCLLWGKFKKMLSKRGSQKIKRGSPSVLSPSGSGQFPGSSYDPGHLSLMPAPAMEYDPFVETTFGRIIPIQEYTMPRIWSQLKAKSDYEARVLAVKEFNASNRWQKKGISITACRYHMSPPAQPAAVSIYGDGSILVAAAGAEIGQGLFTKVKQVAIYELSKALPERLRPLPLDLVRIADNSSELLPNAGCTGGSTTSEASCEAVRCACAKLVERIKPFVEQAGPKARWEDIIALILPAGGAPPNTLMSEYALYDGNGVNPDGTPAAEKLDYHSFGAAVSEVMIDMITGDRRVLRTDLLYDCGRSLNPAVDIGQVEGAFMQGLGYVLQEEVVIDPVTGENLTDSTWEYKIPTAACIPREFHIHFLEDSPNPRGIMSSKAVGEPPLLLSSSVLIAMQSAVSAAVREIHPGLAAGRCHMLPQALKMRPPCSPLEIRSAVGDFCISEILEAAEKKVSAVGEPAASYLSPVSLLD